MKKQLITVTSTAYGLHTSTVYFDGQVYRWESNDRVPPKDSIKEFGICNLPNYDAAAHDDAREHDIQEFLRNWKQPKKKRTTIREQAEHQIGLLKKAVQNRICLLEPHPMGHAFLWGTVEVILKNGKSRFYKVCLGSVCAEDLDEAVRLANQVKGVSKVYYNLD